MAGKRVSANNNSATKKRAGNPNWKKGGASPNPKGAPKRGERWADVIRRISSMTGAEAAEYGESVARQLKLVGDKVTLKEAAVLRVFVSLMNEPTPGLFNSLIDRDDGPVESLVKHSGNAEQPLVIRVIREGGYVEPAEPASGTAADQA